MKKTARKPACIVRLFVLLPLLMAAPLPGQAQSSDPGYAGDSQTAQKDDDRRVNIYAQTAIEYTDNVFRLSKSDQTKMEDNAIEDQTSGRYKDMESVSDCIVSPEVG